ncbi:MAG: B12-binding domain-containing radical SAM protein [Pyrinomonadaceae bacterium]|nr:B12-binding domain-containing radical SAM protein [Phycisphaerales bacterium]
MPHVALVCLSGFRVRDREMIALGMCLPGLSARAGAIGALPGLGLLTLAGMTPPEWSVSYHESVSVDDDLLDEITLLRPALVGISALTASISEAYVLSERLRAQGIRTVLGGLHVTSCPGEAAMHADAVVVGDGEPVWGEVLRDAVHGAPGRIHRSAAPFDLSLSPTPRFDLLGTKPRPRFTLQTSRGCPLACEFCGASRLLGPFREKPIARIQAELEAIQAMSRRPTLELADDNTFAGKRDPAALLGTLGLAGVRYFTEADWRIGERPDVLEHLAASGCVQVLIGMESLVHSPRGMGAKAAPLPRIMDAVGRIQDAGVAVIGCFIVGCDGETHDTMHALGEFLIDAPLADVQLTLQTPFPGTALHEKLRRAGRLLPDRGWDSYTLFDVTYQPDPMSASELQSAFHSLVKYVFAAEPARRRMETRQRIWANRYTENA